MTTNALRPETGTPRGQREAVQALYDQTWLDFRLLWLNPTTLACHFGYSDATTRSHADTLLRLNAVLAERAAVRPGERVFDAGCGVGGSSLWLAERCGARVVGATLSGRQARQAARFATQRGLGDRAHFLRADYTCTAFPDACFDVVWAIESICYAPAKAAFYAEAARLLRPGGRLVAAEFVRSRRAMAGADEGLLRAWLRGWAMPDLDTYQEHGRALAAAGFHDIALDDITAHIRPSSRRLHRMARASYGIGAALNRLGVRSQVQHGNLVAARLQYDALERGLWRYGLLSATRA